MNKLSATIIHIESADYISLVDLQVNTDKFSCVIIETPETAPYLFIGNKVYILFKETEVSIGKGFSGSISLRNRLHSTITGIETGKVLAQIALDYGGTEVRSIITSRSVKKLDLKVGDAVVGFIKANEVSIWAE